MLGNSHFILDFREVGCPVHDLGFVIVVWIGVVDLQFWLEFRGLTILKWPILAFNIKLITWAFIVVDASALGGSLAMSVEGLLFSVICFKWLIFIQQLFPLLLQILECTVLKNVILPSSWSCCLPVPWSAWSTPGLLSSIVISFCVVMVGCSRGWKEGLSR